MSKHQHLPTLVSGEWSIAAFRDSFVSALAKDRSCQSLSMYFYAVTQSGWDQVREPILRWSQSAHDRTVSLFVGTDHGITDPSALKQISEEGVKVRMMLEYNGVFHPKVIWLRGDERSIVWVGSNNLTRDGLLNNVEFALLVKTQQVPTELNQWAHSVRSGSVELSQSLLISYERDRRQFEKNRARKKLTTFTWCKRLELPKDEVKLIAEAGNLIVEVMPKETGGDGRQLQLPVKAACDFFNVEGVGSSKEIRLRSKNSSTFRSLKITVFKNNTVRIVISDLEYRDRPCVLVFREVSNEEFEYEIVSESIFPIRYMRLLNLCGEKTRQGSRRWGIV